MDGVYDLRLKTRYGFCEHILMGNRIPPSTQWMLSWHKGDVSFPRGDTVLQTGQGHCWSLTQGDTLLSTGTPCSRDRPGVITAGHSCSGLSTLTSERSIQSKQRLSHSTWVVYTQLSLNPPGFRYTVSLEDLSAPPSPGYLLKLEWIAMQEVFKG